MRVYLKDYVTATDRHGREVRRWLTELLPAATWDWSGCTDTGDISAATTCTTPPPRKLSISSPVWELCTTPGSTSRNSTWGTTMTLSGNYNDAHVCFSTADSSRLPAALNSVDIVDAGVTLFGVIWYFIASSTCKCSWGLSKLLEQWCL